MVTVTVTMGENDVAQHFMQAVAAVDEDANATGIRAGRIGPLDGAGRRRQRGRARRLAVVASQVERVPLDALVRAAVVALENRDGRPGGIWKMNRCRTAG